MSDDSELVERVKVILLKAEGHAEWEELAPHWDRTYTAMARAAIAEVQRWRPIEEAPKIEGQRLWLWQRGRGGYEGWWNDFGSEGQDWQDDSDSEPAPTHFMELPAPPQ